LQKKIKNSTIIEVRFGIMKFLQKLNPSVKILMVVIYTIILAVASVLIINLKKVDETEGYGSSARDKNIQVVCKIYENRIASSGSTTESASWTASFQITKNNANVEVSNIEMYVKAKTFDGNTIYFEESPQSNSTYKGTPSITGSTFATTGASANRATIKKTLTENGELKLVFVRVLYTVTENEVEKQKELKYYFRPIKPEQENFSNYTVVKQIIADNKSKDIELEKNTYCAPNVRVKLYDDEKTSDRVQVGFKFNEAALKEQGKYVKSASVTVFAKVKNDSSDTKNVISDYITVVDAHGVFVDESNLEAWTTSQVSNLNGFYQCVSSINYKYYVSDLYMLISYTTNDNKTTYDRVKIEVTPGE